MNGGSDQEGLEVALDKERRLKVMLQETESAVIAYSGGVDSAYLLYCAHQVLGPKKVLAVTAGSELVTPEELEVAGSTADCIGANYRVIKLDLVAAPEIKANSPDRCYFCKKIVYGELLRLAEKENYTSVWDGSNADDAGSYRPGLRALQELKIRSPLLEAGLNKEEIRDLSKRAGLPSWNKPAAACLASRFPYGEELTPQKLKTAAAAEQFLRLLGVQNNLRVRCHNDLARIEVGEDDLDLLLAHRNRIVHKFQALGFKYVTLDLVGFQSGSMDLPLF